jgi:recombination protein RecA
MSASPVFSSAAMGRPFIFSPPPSPQWNEDEFAEGSATKSAMTTKAAQILAAVGAAPKLAAVVPASRLDVRPAPEMVSSGIPQLDSLTGGLARGCLTEICGSAASGRTSLLLCALARATQRGEVCALVDASDAFDPASAAAAGMEMSRLLWVRCGERYPSRKVRADARTAEIQRRSSNRGMLPRDLYQGMPSAIPQADKKIFDFSRWESQLGQMLKVTDLLLQSNGFGMIALDLGDVPVQSARRISLASWFRFRRAVEHTPTTLLVLEQQPIAGSCSSMVIKVSANRHQRVSKKLSAVSSQLSENQVPHSALLEQLEITVQLLCSRLERKSERKPVQSTASFRSRAAWAFG